MTLPPPDGSRDPRIEDLSNRLLIHPLARALLLPALRLGVSANAVSLTGLAIGVAAALCFARWQVAGAAGSVAVIAGLVLAVGWLVADGLDGKIARATGTASPFGRVLDGICDHGVFVLIYVMLAAGLGSVGGWLLALAAGAAHALQSTLYEGERARWHRRLRAAPRATAARVPLYDAIAGHADRAGAALDRLLVEEGPDGGAARRYVARALAPLRWQTLLSANARVALITVACLLRRPALFWWVELIVLTAVAAAGMAWHRRSEAAAVAGDDRPSAAIGGHVRG